MSLNDSHSLERTLEYCDKGNDSFLNTTDCSIPNVSISTVATGCPANAKAMSSHASDEGKSHIHFNRLWSVWYGILVTLFQGYLIILGLQKFVGEFAASMIDFYFRHKSTNRFRLFAVDVEKWAAGDRAEHAAHLLRPDASLPAAVPGIGAVQNRQPGE